MKKSIKRSISPRKAGFLRNLFNVNTLPGRVFAMMSKTPLQSLGLTLIVSGFLFFQNVSFALNLLIVGGVFTGLLAIPVLSSIPQISKEAKMQLQEETERFESEWREAKRLQKELELKSWDQAFELGSSQVMPALVKLPERRAQVKPYSKAVWVHYDESAKFRLV